MRRLITLFMMATGAALAAEQFTNADLIRLLQAGMPESVVVKKIESSAATFDTGVDAIIALKKAGASQAILTAVLTRRTAPAGERPAGPTTRDAHFAGLSVPATLGDSHITEELALQPDMLLFRRRTREAVTLWVSVPWSDIESFCYENEQLTVQPKPGAMGYRNYIQASSVKRDLDQGNPIWFGKARKGPRYAVTRHLKGTTSSFYADGPELSDAACVLALAKPSMACPSMRDYVGSMCATPKNGIVGEYTYIDFARRSGAAGLDLGYLVLFDDGLRFYPGINRTAYVNLAWTEIASTCQETGPFFGNIQVRTRRGETVTFRDAKNTAADMYEKLRTLLKHQNVPAAEECPQD